MFKLHPGDVQPKTNVQCKVYTSTLSALKRRMIAAGLSDNSIRPYSRSLSGLLQFHNYCDPNDIEIDDVLDFISFLVEEKQINWRTQKIYTAGLRDDLFA